MKNTTSLSRLLRATALTFALSSMASAHHSFAMFDSSKSLTLQGTVRSFEFTYPHSWLWIDVPDGKGGSEAWGFENAGPAELNRIGGWTRTSVKLGDKVTVKFCQLKSGKHGGVFSSVTLSDGRVLAGQASACAPNLTPAEVGAAR